MKKILRIVILSVTLILVVNFSAIADTMFQNNTAVGDLDSPSWWLEYATRQANTIIDTNCRDDLYGWLGRAQAKAGKIDEANVSASAISNIQNRVYVHIATAKNSHINGNVSGYKTSMDQARSAAFSEKGLEASIFINSAMIAGYLDCNDVQGAISYTESLSDLPQAQRGYHDVQIAYRKIAAYFAQNDNVKETDFILDNNIKASGKDAALVEIAETCIRKDNLTVAEQMAERLNSSDFKDRVYQKLGVAFAQKGNIEKARSLAKTISDPVHKSSIIAAIAKYQVNSGDIDLAEKTVMDITSRDHKIAVYDLMVEKLANDGKLNLAVETIEMMAKMIEDTPMAPDKSKFGSFDDSFKKGVVETMYLCVAKAYFRKGDVENYNRYINKATKSVNEINDTNIWKSQVVMEIINLQLGIGDIEGAMKTAEGIKQESRLSWALFNIVKAQLEKGDIEGAVTTSKKITDTMNKSFASGELASAFVKEGEFAKAKKVLLSLGSSSSESEAYRRAATAFVVTGHTEELANWLNEIPTPQARVCACIGAVDGIIKLQERN